MKHQRSSEPTQRQLRAGELIRHIVAETLKRGHFDDPVLFDADITVSEVRCSPDLKNATAFVMTLGGKDIDLVLPALNTQSHIFQKDIGRQANLKFTPRLRFAIDESFNTASTIESILKDLSISKDPS